MGSGFKQFTASVLTASDVNNYLMEQSVMSFASTGARDVAITAPEDGMVAYIGSNDSSEGLYTYNGTSWRKGPGWNAPWGAVSAPAKNITSPGQTFTSTTMADVTSMTLTPAFVNNRMYRVTFQCLIDNPTPSTTSIGVFRIYNNTTSTQLQQANYTLAAGAFTEVHFMTVISATTSASHQIKVQAAVGGAGQQVRTYLDATFPIFLLIEDIGPYGAPV